jgi:uncharacterized membrane protein
VDGTTASKSNRVEYVDMLRGLAVFGMFVVHTPAPWMLPEYVNGEYGRVVSQISGMVAPVFLFLAGLSAAVIACRAAEKGDGAPFRGRIARRGLEVLLAGYGLNLAFFVMRGFDGGLALILKIDILQCIGASLLLAALLAAPGRRWNWIALAAAVAFVVGAQVTWRAPLQGLMPAGIAGYLAFIQGAARFPLFPYSAWVALGILVGQPWWGASKRPEAERRFLVGLVVAAAVCIAAGFVVKWAYYRYGLDGLWTNGAPPPRTTVHHFLFKAGGVFALFLAARLGWRAASSLPGKALVLLGRTSLFAYCGHLLAVYHVFGPFMKRSLGPLGHAIGVAALTAFMIAACLAWSKARAKWRGR